VLILGITNLRGSDIPYNPLFFSFGILYINDNEEYFHLYANKDKFAGGEFETYFKENRIKLFGYDEIYTHLKNSNSKLVVDKSSINQNLLNYISNNNPDSSYRVLDKDPIFYTKCIKHEREIKGMKECNLRDSAALVRFFAWLEDELLNKGGEVTEYEAALKVLDFRKQNDLFVGESFPPISSSGSNSAIIHYKPDRETCSKIDKNKIYLLDSGGQYL
jgi:Xaa-Pro aminopeptidase